MSLIFRLVKTASIALLVVLLIVVFSSLAEAKSHVSDKTGGSKKDGLPDDWPENPEEPEPESACQIEVQSVDQKCATYGEGGAIFVISVNTPEA
jgi:hypothetical protein